MADFVIMPRSDYISICDAVRDKADISGALTSRELPSVIGSIDTEIIYDEDIANYITGDMTEIVIPNNVSTIRNYGFYRMSNLESIIIPDSVTRIGVEAFRECSILPSVTIPAGTEIVTYRAFSYCQLLETVEFLGTPERIQTDVFKGSPVLDIYVPWGEGDVDGAPWGATDATIHYHTGAEK